MNTAPVMRKGGKYNWKGQAERLVYLGRNWSGNGYWHQFELVEAPGTIWCEVLDDQLPSFEETSPLDGMGALAIGPERDGQTPYLYAPMADLDEIAKAIHAWRNPPPSVGTDAEGRRMVTFGTGKIAKWSGEAEVLKLTDDGYRIRFSWVSGGPVNAAEYDGELWADYKQCNLPGPAADIADYLMQRTPLPDTATDETKAAVSSILGTYAAGLVWERMLAVAKKGGAA